MVDLDLLLTGHGEMGTNYGESILGIFRGPGSYKSLKYSNAFYVRGNRFSRCLQRSLPLFVRDWRDRRPTECPIQNGDI